VSIHLEKVLRADWRYYGLPSPAASRGGRFLVASELFSPLMGSSGSKKTRKGQPRQHLAKVGTPAANSHTTHAAERDVAGNFGVRGKGWLYWGAVAVLVLIVVVSLLSWIFWF
jgi:hypothetical protein